MATYTEPAIKGLHTSGNQLGVLKGGLALADNCVLQEKDRLAPRRGLSLASYGIGAGTVLEQLFFQDTLLEQYGSSLAHDTGAAMAAFAGSFASPSPSTTRIKSVIANKNLLFTNSSGVQVLDALTNNPVAAGVPKAVDSGTDPAGLLVARSYNAGAGWAPSNNQWAYRVAFGIKDANNNVKLGAPSGRINFTNPVDLVVPIGGLVRTANVVAGTVPASPGNAFQPSAGFSLSPGEANFPAGQYQMSDLNSIASFSGASFRYPDARANATSTVQQTISGNLAMVNLQITLPPGLTTSHFMRIYRSRASGLAIVSAADELFLVAEVAVTAGFIAAGKATYIDITPDAFLQDPLYTNPATGDGVDQANERPPLALDVASWNDRAWYINTTDRNRFILNLLGTGSGTGLLDGDTITIAGTTYTARNSASLATEFQLFTYGTPAQNIFNTTMALIQTINAVASGSSVSAFYLSGPNDAPGRMMFEERAIGGAAFTCYSSKTSAWFPALTTGSAGALTSLNAKRTNGVSFSKLGQPEAVPVQNFKPIGALNQDDTLRALRLRDKLFCFNARTGVYTVSGQYPFNVEQLDETTRLLVPDTLVSCGNQLFGLTNQGVVAVSDAGCRIVSKPIEDQLQKLLGSALAQVKQYGFGVAYDSDHEYILFLPSSSSDTSCTQAFVYNFLNDAWTRWTGNWTCGRVHPTQDKLYLGDGAVVQHRIERKSFSAADYVDGIDNPLSGWVTTVISSTQVQVDTGVGYTPVVGDLFTQDGFSSVIAAYEPGAGTLTLADAHAWNLHDPTVTRAFQCTVKFDPLRCDKAAWTKNWKEVVFHFGGLAAGKAGTLTGTSDTTNVNAEQSFSLPTKAVPGYPVDVRNSLPTESNRSTMIRLGFKVREAFSQWTLDGFSVEYELISERIA